MPQTFMSKLIQNVLRRFAGKEFSVLTAQIKHPVFFIRHGQSEWNEKNLFCGWHDAPLTKRGQDEAKTAGASLKEIKIVFDKGFASKLTRSIETLNLMLIELGQDKLPIERNWRLNERHYGNLTGMNKAEAADLFGKEKVHMWRRSFDTKPPKMLEVNPYYKEVMDGKRFDLKPSEVPFSESLKDTIERTLPYWKEVIEPEIKKGKIVIVAAHGNSLRGIVKYIDKISDEGIKHLNLPTGIPFMYMLGKDMYAIDGEDRVKFFGDPKRVEKAMQDLTKAKKTK